MHALQCFVSPFVDYFAVRLFFFLLFVLYFSFHSLEMCIHYFDVSFLCAAEGKQPRQIFTHPFALPAIPVETMLRRNTANERAVDHKSNKTTKARFLARRETFRSKVRLIFCCRCFLIFFFWWMLVTQRR